MKALRVDVLGLAFVLVWSSGCLIGALETTSLIACSSPLPVAVISALAGWERLSAVQWAGIGLGVAGVAVTLADRVGRPPSLGVLPWTLLGMAGLAGGAVLQSRVRTSAGPAAVAATELAAGFAVLAVWAPLRGSLTILLTGHALGSFAWLALVTLVGAPLLLFALIRSRGATRASSYLFVVPAVTAVAAWPILGTPVGMQAVAGLGVVATGLWLARPRPQPERTTRPSREVEPARNHQAATRRGLPQTRRRHRFR